MHLSLIKRSKDWMTQFYRSMHMDMIIHMGMDIHIIIKNIVIIKLHRINESKKMIMMIFTKVSEMLDFSKTMMALFKFLKVII